MLKKILMLGVILSMAICTSGCASCAREMKSLCSDFGGGLDRTVTVYDYNGETIKSWTGTFDVSASENEVFFDLNGKRIIIHGGIVINEEN